MKRCRQHRRFGSTARRRSAIARCHAESPRAAPGRFVVGAAAGPPRSGGTRGAPTSSSWGGRSRIAAADSGTSTARLLQVQPKNVVADLFCELSLPNGRQISCRPYEARAHTNKCFHFAASDGAARTEPRADRPVGCICGLGGAF